MISGYEDLFSFLQGYGFCEEELFSVSYELDAYRSIPGTTLGRYLNRVVSSLAEEDRNPFLKGIMMGVALRKAVDDLQEPDLTEEERQVSREIEDLKSGKR